MVENYSVLMSVYHKEKPEYFRAAIDSILNQTVKTDDFVIVCDGPLNKGLDNVITDYVRTAPGLFNIYRLSKNMGLAKALNNGLLQCKNERIARMDSDDISAPDRIEKQLKAMEENDADIVGCNIIEFTENIENTGSVREVPEKQTEIMKFAKKRTPFNHPAVMYKKSAVIDSGFYEDYRYFEDYNLWTTMLLKGYKGYNVQENLVYMRAGQDMYKRRGGLGYVKCIFRFKNHLRKTGFISTGAFLVGALGHSLVSIVPNRVRTGIYAKVLRKSGNKI
jgi:glycosyltransferase involved in cell wall biosynthesis